MKRKLLTGLVAGAMIVSTLAGCGASSGSSDANANAGGNTAAESTADAGTDAGAAEESGAGSYSNGGAGATEFASTGSLSGLSDGVLDIGYPMGWDSLTPFRSNIANNAPFHHQLYETLISKKADGSYAMIGAKSYEFEDDNKTVNIEIYDNIMDSAGNHITASDVAWLINESKTQALKPSFAKVDTCEAVDDTHVKMVMTEDMVGAAEEVMNYTFLVSQKAYEESADGFSTDVVSTSPYKLTSFVSGSEIGFEKRDDYWQDESLVDPAFAANVPKITYHIITEASQAGIALETGTIDAFCNLDANTANQFVDKDGFFMSYNPTLNASQIFFSGHESRTVANDVKLRQAICYAIDAEGLITGVYAGYGEPMHDSVSKVSSGYLAKWLDEEYYSYDPDKAKELLAESNYNGESLVIYGTSSTTAQRLAQMIQGYLGAVGITAEIQNVDSALFTATRLDGSYYDMLLNNVGGDALPNHWSIRYDMNAYSTGDGTSRHDEELAELLYKTWTIDGFTEENIDAVHNYIKENMYAYGMVQTQCIDVWSNDLGLTNAVIYNTGEVNYASSTYNE